MCNLGVFLTAGRIPVMEPFCVAFYTKDPYQDVGVPGYNVCLDFTVTKETKINLSDFQVRGVPITSDIFEVTYIITGANVVVDLYDDSVHGNKFHSIYAGVSKDLFHISEANKIRSLKLSIIGTPDVPPQVSR